MESASGTVKPVAPDDSSGNDRLMSPALCGIETGDDDSLDAIFAEVGIVGRQRWSDGWTPVSPLPSSPVSSLVSVSIEQLIRFGTKPKLCMYDRQTGNFI